VSEHGSIAFRNKDETPKWLAGSHNSLTPHIGDRGSLFVHQPNHNKRYFLSTTTFLTNYSLSITNPDIENDAPASSKSYYRISPRSQKRSQRRYPKPAFKRSPSAPRRGLAPKLPEVRSPSDLSFSTDSLPEVNKKASIDVMDYMDNVNITPDATPKGRLAKEAESPVLVCTTLRTILICIETRSRM
jgi:hypothetical protein